MPDNQIVKRARRVLSEGKRLTSAAGEFIREEIQQISRGRPAMKSPQQALTRGLKKARQAGLPVPLPKAEARPARRKVRKSAQSAAYRRGKQAAAASKRKTTARKSISRRKSTAGKTSVAKSGRAAAGRGRAAIKRGSASSKSTRSSQKSSRSRS